uniref:Carboxylesterase type B domain-containing protein n=1 Tax=Ciona savignyi TaxID=51511 RepID=H2YX76_CIOSA
MRKYNKKIDLKKVLPLLLEKYGLGFNEKDKLFYSNIYGKIFGDCVFTNGIIQTTQAYADAGEQVYFYYMTHQPLLNHDSRFGIETAKKPDYIGADHADDIYFTFGLPFLPQNLKNGFRFSYGEEEMSKKMMTYFTNFAKSGNPNMPVKLELEWPLYDTKSKQHIEFKTPTLGLGENLGKDSMHLYSNELSKL